MENLGEENEPLILGTKKIQYIFKNWGVSKASDRMIFELFSIV
jgi:hypothetical protein